MTRLFLRSLAVFCAILLIGLGQAKAAGGGSAVAQGATAGGATPGATIAIPDGTLVHVRLVDRVSSASAKVGDTFAFVAADNVVVGGWIVVAKGALGQGEVATVDRAGPHGHAGTLGIQFNWILASDAEKLHLTSQRDPQQGMDRGRTSRALTVASTLLLGIPGLFAHNFVHGKDVVIDGTMTTLDAFTSGTVHIAATVKAVDEGFAH